jgi:hypothetical protein
VSNTFDESQCTHTSPSGQRCQQAATDLSEEPLCYVHQAATQDEMAGYRAKGGQRNTELAAQRQATPEVPPAATPTASVTPDDLKDVAGVRRFLVNVTIDLAAGRISARTATVLEKLAAGVLRAEDRGLAERLSKIEKAIAAQASEAPPEPSAKRRRR